MHASSMNLSVKLRFLNTAILLQFAVGKENFNANEFLKLQWFEAKFATLNV